MMNYMICFVIYVEWIVWMNYNLMVPIVVGTTQLMIGMMYYMIVVMMIVMTWICDDLCMVMNVIEVMMMMWIVKWNVVLCVVIVLMRMICFVNYVVWIVLMNYNLLVPIVMATTLLMIGMMGYMIVVIGMMGYMIVVTMIVMLWNCDDYCMVMKKGGMILVKRMLVRNWFYGSDPMIMKNFCGIYVFWNISSGDNFWIDYGWMD